MRLSIKYVICLLVLALAVAPLAAQDWAGRGRALGVVQDEQGRPIEGAKIQLHLAGSPGSGPEPFYTDKKGRWSYLGLGQGVFQVLIDAEGFMPSEGTYQVDQFGTAKPAEITLARNPQASIGKGDQLLDGGDAAAARVEYMKALEGLDAVGQARLRTRIGDTYLKDGNLEAAQAEYQQALPQLSPEEQSHVRLQLGNAHQSRRDFAAARAEYEKAVALLPPESQASVLLAVAEGYDQEDNRAAAIETLERALALVPGNVQALQVLADLLTREGREEEAQNYLAQLPEDAEIPTDMVLNMGIKLYNDGKSAEALELFDRAVGEDPENPEVYYYRGLSHLSLAENDLATADFKKLLELDPGGPHEAEVREFLEFLEGQG